MRFKRHLLILALAIGIALCLGGYFYYHTAVNRNNPDSDEAVRFTIQSGQGVSEIAENLYAVRLIDSPFLFKVYVKLSNIATNLQAGEYAIPRNLSMKEVADALQKGVFDYRLTFIEGWRREEIAAYLAKELGEKFAEDFLVVSEGKEGYLFPDTYFVTLDIEASELVERMLDNFESKLNLIAASPHLSEDLIILASIVEREARFSKDRPIIAGILWKRYQNGWPLEADATVQFAIAQTRCLEVGSGKVGCTMNVDFEYWPKEITAEDLEVDSPYNTRKYVGLPPGPICNPGLDSLKAAIQPKETSYWFYVSDPEGHIHYAETIEEHNKNIARVMR